MTVEKNVIENLISYEMQEKEQLAFEISDYNLLCYRITITKLTGWDYKIQMITDIIHDDCNHYDYPDAIKKIDTALSKVVDRIKPFIEKLSIEEFSFFVIPSFNFEVTFTGRTLLDVIGKMNNLIYKWEKYVYHNLDPD